MRGHRALVIVATVALLIVACTAPSHPEPTPSQSVLTATSAALAAEVAARAVHTMTRLPDGSPAGGPRRQCSWRTIAERRSLFSQEMTSMGISLGQAAAHSPMFVQPPNPSASCCATIDTTRWSRSG
jgi:hypothetical protein